MLDKVLFTLACLVLPIVWGVVVNWLFDLWRQRNGDRTRDDEPVFPDYQI